MSRFLPALHIVLLLLLVSSPCSRAGLTGVRDDDGEMTCPVCDVTSFVDCVYQDTYSRWIVVFGYENHQETACTVPVSIACNLFSPPMDNQVQPTEFQPGIHHAVISSTILAETGVSIWHLMHDSAMGDPTNGTACCLPSECPPSARKQPLFPNLMANNLARPYANRHIGGGVNGKNAQNLKDGCVCAPPGPPAPDPQPTTTTVIMEPTTTESPEATITTTVMQVTTTVDTPAPTLPPCHLNLGGPCEDANGNITTDDVDIDIESYCTMTVMTDSDRPYYIFNLSQLVPPTYRVVIELQSTADGMRTWGSCDSMLPCNATVWADCWAEQHFDNGWELADGSSGSRIAVKRPIDAPDLASCVSFWGDSALGGFCSADNYSANCLGTWYATIIRATDESNETMGEDWLYQAPCTFTLTERLSGTVSTTFYSETMSVIVTWYSYYCDANPGSERTVFSLMTCIQPWTVEEPIRLVNPTITSQSPDYGFEYYWNDEECDVRGQWCCQRNAFRALGVVPPLNASLDIEWNPEVSGVVIDTQFVRTHVNLHLADKCEGNDVNSNFTCDANLQLYEDAELTRDYEAETCMPYLDGSRVYALVNISDQCCSLQNRYMEIIQARVCWSTNEVQLVAFDEGYPDETGCNTAGADVQTIIVYDAYDEYDPACEATITNGTGCSRVVAWKAIMHSSPETVNVIEIDWQLTLIPPPLLLGQPQSELHTTGFTMNSPERDLQRSAYENLVNPGMPMGMGAPLLGAGEIGDIDFDAEEFFIQCNESDLVWSWEDHACIHDHFWHWSSHVLFIIGACVLALLIIACIIGCAYSHHHHDDDDEEHHHRHHHKHDEVEYVRPVVNEYTFAYRMPSQPVDDAGKVKNI